MRLLAILIGLTLIITQGAQAQVMLRAATFDPQGSPAAQGLQAFADTLRSCTNGQLYAEVFADGTFGRPRELVDQLINGSIDVAVVSASALQPYYQSAGILSAPLIFYNRRHWETALSGPVIKAIDDELANSAGLRVLGFMGGEQLGILSTSPITTPEDLEGQSIRVAGIDENIFKALGARPVQTAFTEVFTALRTGAIDATEATADFVTRTKAYEVASEFATSNHRILTDLLVMNSAGINKLSDDGRACLSRAAEAASSTGRDAVVSIEQAALAELSELGVVLRKIGNRPALFDRARGATSDIVSEFQAEKLYSLIMSSFTCPTWCGDSSCDDDECKACKVCE